MRAAAGVPHVLEEERGHRLEDAPVDGGGRVIVEVERKRVLRLLSRAASFIRLGRPSCLTFDRLHLAPPAAIGDGFLLLAMNPSGRPVASMLDGRPPAHAATSYTFGNWLTEGKTSLLQAGSGKV